MMHNVYRPSPARYTPADVFVGTPGNDTLTGTAGADTMDGGAGDDFMTGGDGDDVLRGRGGYDSLYGGLGNDTLYGGGDSDFMYGNEGDDLLLAGDGLAGELSGGAGNDTLHGNGRYYQSYDGGDGNDVVLGNDGIDILLDYDADADTLNGGAGMDTLQADWSDATADIVWVNDPTQVQKIYGNTVSGLEHLNLTLGTGNDVVDNRLSGIDSMTFIHGGDGNDSLTGSGSTDVGADYLYGDAGNDTLTAVGSGELNGGWGDDVLQGSVARNQFNGGAGNDRIDCGAQSDEVIDSDSDADSAFGGGGIDSYVGNWAGIADAISWTLDPLQTQVVHDNTLRSFEALTLTLGAGADYVDASKAYSSTLSGGDGNDTLIGSAGAGRIEGNDGDDTLVNNRGRIYGGSGNDVLDGRGKASTGLFGEDGDDTLTGSDSRESLRGGAGNDVLTGGGGNDSFMCEGGSDLVRDFETTYDDVVLSTFYLPVGNKDYVIDGAVTTAGPGGFNAKAELVIVTADIDGAITASSAAAAIGSASTDYAENRTVVFAVDNGADSAVYYFKSSGADAVVSANELTLLATLQGASSTVVDDYYLAT